MCSRAISCAWSRSHQERRSGRKSPAFTTTSTSCTETGSKKINFSADFFDFWKLLLTLSFHICGSVVKMKY